MKYFWRILPWLLAVIAVSIYIFLERKADKMLALAYDGRLYAGGGNNNCYHCPPKEFYSAIEQVKSAGRMPFKKADASNFLKEYINGAYHDFSLGYYFFLMQFNTYNGELSNSRPYTESYQPEARYRKLTDFCHCWKDFFQYSQTEIESSPFPKAYQAVCEQQDTFVTVPWLESHLEIYE